MFCFPSLWIGSLSFIHIVYVRHAENVASVADVFLALFMWLVFSSYINSLALLFSLEKYAVRFASLCCFSLFISQACFFAFYLSYSLTLLLSCSISPRSLFFLLLSSFFVLPYTVPASIPLLSSIHFLPIYLYTTSVISHAPNLKAICRGYLFFQKTQASMTDTNKISKKSNIMVNTNKYDYYLAMYK